MKGVSSPPPAVGLLLYPGEMTMADTNTKTEGNGIILFHQWEKLKECILRFPILETEFKVFSVHGEKSTKIKRDILLEFIILVVCGNDDEKTFSQ